MGLALQAHSAHTCNACMREVVHMRSQGTVVEPFPKCMLTLATFFSHLAHTMQSNVKLL